MQTPVQQPGHVITQGAVTPLDTVRALSVDIGPRPSASSAEERAAHYVAERLRDAGFETRVAPFDGLRTFSLTYGLIYALFLLAALLMLWNSVAAFAVALLGLLTMGLENNGYEILSRFLPKVPSRNVIGVKPPAGDIRQRVVLCCHLDSAKSGLLWHPKLVTNFRASFLQMAGSMLLLVALTGWATWEPLPLYARLLLILAALHLFLACLLLLHREVFMRYVAGANDNASGVAAVLDAARRCGDLQHTQLWVVANGCEESGLLGMARFCDTHDFAPQTTVFLNADNCGMGRVAYTRSEGMLWRYRCDPQLVEIARRASAAAPPLDTQSFAFHAMNNDSFQLLRRGYRALSVMACDERGLLPNWHWRTDVIENIDETTLNTAAELLRRMVRMLEEAT